MRRSEAQEIIKKWAARSQRNTDAIIAYTEAVKALKRSGLRFYVDFGYLNVCSKRTQLRRKQ